MDVELVFIPHSRERMETRDVTELQIGELLRRHSLSAPGDRPGRTRYIGNLSSGETLSVVIQSPLDKTGLYTVITAHFKGEERLVDKVRLEIDMTQGIACMCLSSQPVARTVELSDTMMSDMDAMGAAMGLGLPDFDEKVPIDLLQKHHVHSEVAEEPAKL